MITTYWRQEKEHTFICNSITNVLVLNLDSQMFIIIFLQNLYMLHFLLYVQNVIQ